MFWGVMIGLIAGYILGFSDGKWGKPPEPLKGNYEHCEDPEDEEYNDLEF